MGKGDIKTRRGKLFRGTFGKTRPKKRIPSGIPAAEKATKDKAIPAPAVKKSAPAGKPLEEVQEIPVKETPELNLTEEAKEKAPVVAEEQPAETKAPEKQAAAKARTKPAPAKKKPAAKPAEAKKEVQKEVKTTAPAKKKTTKPAAVKTTAKKPAAKKTGTGKTKKDKPGE